MIAASSHRTGRKDGLLLGEDILSLHLQELLKTNTKNLSQVTLLRTLPLVRNDPKLARKYWDVNHLLGQLDCDVEVLDVDDAYYSYSSWMRGCEKYGDKFDYHILIEDDYYPTHPDFVPVLIDLHLEKLPTGGFLCGFISDCPAVSNGIIDAKTFIEGSKKNYLQILSQGAQTYFGTLFDNKIADYTDRYRCLFKSTEIFNETHDKNSKLTTDIFCPIEYLFTGEQDFRKSVRV